VTSRNSPAAIAAPGPAGNLENRLTEPFRGAKIGAEQGLVDIQHGRQGDARQVVALGQHLGADQDAGPPVADLFQQVFEIVLPVMASRSTRWTGTSGNSRRRNSSRRSVPAPTAAVPAIRNPGSAVEPALRAAVMALQPGLALVPGQVRAAAMAIGLPAAGIAHQYRGITAPVAIQQHLAVLRRGGAAWPRPAAGASSAVLTAPVDDRQRG
jgi:hypothetical protein